MYFTAHAGGENGSIYLQALAKYLQQEYMRRPLDKILKMVRQYMIKKDKVLTDLYLFFIQYIKISWNRWNTNFQMSRFWVTSLLSRLKSGLKIGIMLIGLCPLVLWCIHNTSIGPCVQNKSKYIFHSCHFRETLEWSSVPKKETVWCMMCFSLNFMTQVVWRSAILNKNLVLKLVAD